MVLIAVPITLQVYFNASLAYGLMKLLKVEHSVAAPGALIGASNFFELAVATAIALFGPESGAALATVVGRAGGGPGDAVGLCGVQSDTALVSGSGGKVEHDEKEEGSDSLYRKFGPKPDGRRVCCATRRGDRFEVFSAGTKPSHGSAGSDRGDAGDRHRHFRPSLEVRG